MTMLYRHVLIPVDCRLETRFAAYKMADFLGPITSSQIYLVAATSPSDTEEARQAKVRHANQALMAVSRVFRENGVYTHHRLIEGIADGDLARATILESQSRDIPYNVILLGTHHTFAEDFDTPCAPTMAQRLATKVNLPLLVLPTSSTISSK